MDRSMCGTSGRQQMECPQRGDVLNFPTVGGPDGSNDSQYKIIHGIAPTSLADRDASTGVANES